MGKGKRGNVVYREQIGKEGGKWINIFHKDGTYKELAYEYEIVNSIQEVI